MDEKQVIEELSKATCNIIEMHGRILLRGEDGWYVGPWTNFAGGTDSIHWTHRPGAMEISDLWTAHQLARIVRSKRVSVVIALPAVSE